MRYCNQVHVDQQNRKEVLTSRIRMGSICAAIATTALYEDVVVDKELVVENFGGVFRNNFLDMAG